VVARLPQQLELGTRRRQLQQLLRRFRLHGDDPSARARSPLEQLRRQLAAVGADLEDRLGPNSVKAAEEDLGDVDERIAELIGVGFLWVGWHRAAVGG